MDRLNLHNNNWVTNGKEELSAKDKTKIEGYKEREREQLVPLKVNRYTTIMVTRDKCTPEYAKEWEEKFRKKFYDV